MEKVTDPFLGLELSGQVAERGEIMAEEHAQILKRKALTSAYTANVVTTLRLFTASPSN